MNWSDKVIEWNKEQEMYTFSLKCKYGVFIIAAPSIIDALMVFQNEWYIDAFDEGVSIHPVIGESR